MRIQAIERTGEFDAGRLEFAASADRILLTHDKRLIPFVVDRIEKGKPTPGVFVIHQLADMGEVL